jgi:1-acyl-sn-glycerol-3-phosphate acyltransferase
MPRPPRESRRGFVVIRWVVNLLFTILTRRRVTGMENIPAQGGCLLVFNHLSIVDPALVVALIGRTDVTGLVASDYCSRAFFRWFVEACGGIWLRRGESDRAALRAALARLEEGWIIGIAPEGGRSRTRTLGPGQLGPAFLAVRADVPLVPVGLENTENLAHALSRMQRSTLRVRIGPPFRLPPPGHQDRKAYVQACTDLIMCQVAAQVSPAYRGVYAEHPLLQELLSTSPSKDRSASLPSEEGSSPPET